MKRWTLYITAMPSTLLACWQLGFAGVPVAVAVSVAAVLLIATWDAVRLANPVVPTCRYAMLVTLRPWAYRDCPTCGGYHPKSCGAQR